MSKDQKLLIVLIAVIVIIAGAFGVYAFKHKGERTCKSEITDAIKFKREYEEFNGKKYDNSDIEYFNVELDQSNVFKYTTEKDAVKFLNEGTGVIYFGFAQCPWCRTLVPYLNEIAKLNGVKEVYYLNILDIRDSYKFDENGKVVIEKEGTKEYYEILKKLDKYLDEFYITNEKGKKFDTGVKRLYAPTTVVVKNGDIGVVYEGTVDTQEKFVPLTDDEVKELRNKLNEIMAPLSTTMCTDSGC